MSHSLHQGKKDTADDQLRTMVVESYIRERELHVDSGLANKVSLRLEGFDVNSHMIRENTTKNSHQLPSILGVYPSRKINLINAVNNQEVRRPITNLHVINKNDFLAPGVQAAEKGVRRDDILESSIYGKNSMKEVVQKALEKVDDEGINQIAQLVVDSQPLPSDM